MTKRGVALSLAVAAVLTVASAATADPATTAPPFEWMSRAESASHLWTGAVGPDGQVVEKSAFDGSCDLAVYVALSQSWQTTVPSCHHAFLGEGFDSSGSLFVAFRPSDDVQQVAIRKYGADGTPLGMAQISVPDFRAGAFTVSGGYPYWWDGGANNPRIFQFDPTTLTYRSAWAPSGASCYGSCRLMPTAVGPEGFVNGFQFQVDPVTLGTTLHGPMLPGQSPLSQSLSCCHSTPSRGQMADPAGHLYIGSWRADPPVVHCYVSRFSPESDTPDWQIELGTADDAVGCNSRWWWLITPAGGVVVLDTTSQTIEGIDAAGVQRWTGPTGQYPAQLLVGGNGTVFVVGRRLPLAGDTQCGSVPPRLVWYVDELDATGRLLSHQETFGATCPGSPSDLGVLDATPFVLAHGALVGWPTYADGPNTFSYFLSRIAVAPGITQYPDSTSVTPTPCAGYDAAFIGVRGSGDNSHGAAFPGRHAIGIAQRLASQYHLKLYDNDGGGDHVIGLAYPASSVSFPFSQLPSYPSSVSTGAHNLLSLISSLRASCGSQFPILLAGHSQGAHVIQSAVEILDDRAKVGDGTWRSIAGVALLASPRFQPLDATGRATFVGGYPLQGIVGPSVVRLRFVGLTRSYCLANDPVCSYSKSNLLLNRYVHTHNYDACIAISPTCPSTSPSGKLIADDAAGLLAWDVAHRSSKDVVPKPVGALTAYRHLSSVRVSAGTVYADGSPTVSFAWDFTNDGHTDATTAFPWMTHGYGATGGQVRTSVRIKHADGRVTVRSICIRRDVVGAVTC